MNKALRFLHLEDEPDYAALVQQTLEQAGLQVTTVVVSDLAGFAANLEKESFDLILADYHLPTCTGMEALKIVREQCPDIPFLLISGTIGEQAAIESLRSGATDYVLKQWPERLVPAIHRALQSGRERRQRKEAESQLRLLGKALESAANTIVIADRSGTVVWVNAAFTQMTGYSAGEILGRTPRLLKSEVQNQAFYEHLWSTILGGRVWRSELVNRRKDGSLYTEECSITPVRNEGREITHFIAVKQDITERKELEAQLRQAQKMDAIGQLAGGIAHDFNNILTVILGHAQMWLHSVDSPSSAERDAPQQIHQAAEKAAGLTRQLLAFSRRQVLRMEPLDLNERVRDLTKMLRRILGEDITLRMTCSPQPAVVMADAVMMEQVLLNLAVNARDAMPNGGVLDVEVGLVDVEPCHVVVQAEAQPGKHVCLRVADQGCGIAPEHLSHVFEPFFTTKDVGKGTGLGLATVHGIVRQHGGWVEVESELGHGTTFRVYLPIAVGVGSLAGDVVAERPPCGTSAEVILVVEDEATVREMTCGFLTDCGYTVLWAESGVKAVEVWGQHKDRIALLLTDLVMPDRMNGWELAEVLRSERPELKVLFTSGYGIETVGKEFVLQHGKHFLQKPYVLNVLATTVRECLDAP